MRKICLALALLLLTPFAFKVFAATLTLDKIGALSTDGKVYSEWWYTGTDPVISGQVESGKSVNINVDGTSVSVTADSQGLWAYYLEAGSGDHIITITSEGESLSFTLHLGQPLPTSGTSSESSETTTPVPETGVSQVLLITLSLMLMTAGWYLYENKSVKKSFEEAVIRDRN